MGRSVSTPSGALITAYAEIEKDADFWCSDCHSHYDRDQVVNCGSGVRKCPSCGADHDECGVERDDMADFEDRVRELRSALKRSFPSLYDYDDWIDRENRVLLANRHAFFGISRYCSLVCVWAVNAIAHRNEWGATEGDKALAERWILSVDGKVEALVHEVFGQGLSLQGTMSNGEAVFHRIDGVPGAPPGLVQPSIEVRP
jgi:hypothetical protein